MKRLRLVTLAIGFICLLGVASGRATRQAQGSEAERRVPPAPDAISPHLDVPKNCKQTQNADGSVLTTCDCENCGHPEARDGMHPVPPYQAREQYNAANAEECWQSGGIAVFSGGLNTGCLWPQGFKDGVVPVPDGCVKKQAGGPGGRGSLRCRDEDRWDEGSKSNHDSTNKNCPQGMTCS